jgi:hypothetical protein
MTEIAHFIDNVRVAGTSGRSQSVFNPATGAAEKTVALATRAESTAPSPPQPRLGRVGRRRRRCDEPVYSTGSRPSFGSGPTN